MRHVLFALPFSLLIGVVGAQATPIVTKSFGQYAIGYVGGGFPGATTTVVGSIAEACKEFVSFNNSGPGLGWYSYFDTAEKQSEGVYVCYMNMIAVDPQSSGRVDHLHVLYGNAFTIYDDGCEGPFLADTTNICSYRPKPEVGKCPSNTCHPINTATGNKLVKERLFVAEGPFPLKFTFYSNTDGGSDFAPNSPRIVRGLSSQFHGYESNKRVLADSVEQVQKINAAATAFTWGGSHTYQRSLRTLDASRVSLSREDGKVWMFEQIGGVWRSVNDVVGTLDRYVGGQGIAWEYVNENDEREQFDGAGRLVRILDRNNLQQVLAYDASGQLETVTDSFGHQIKILRNADQTISITDPNGAIYAIKFDGAHRLSSIAYPDNKSKTFVYENTSFPTHVTGVIDEKNARYMTYEYDDQGRAFREFNAGGVNQYQIAYAADGNSSTLTDPLGATRKLNFKDVNGDKKIVSSDQPGGSGCVAASKSSTYDTKGNVISQLDFRGVSTTTDYDGRNLPIKSIEALGTATVRTISTNWHPTLRKPVGIAVPLLRTTLAYDSVGNLSTKTLQATSDVNGAQGFGAALVGAARTWTYTYNELGLLRTLRGPRTDVNDTATYEYDTSGNLAKVTNAAGHATTMANYDANGRVGRISDANGLVTDLRYSPRGWLTSSSSGGETTTYEHDDAGNLERAVSPGGMTINYHYDDAQRLVGISDNLGNKVAYQLDLIGNRVSEQVRDADDVLTRQVTRIYDVLNRLKQVTGAQQ